MPMVQSFGVPPPRMRRVAFDWPLMSQKRSPGFVGFSDGPLNPAYANDGGGAAAGNSDQSWFEEQVRLAKLEENKDSQKEGAYVNVQRPPEQENLQVMAVPSVSRRRSSSQTPPPQPQAPSRGMSSSPRKQPRVGLVEQQPISGRMTTPRLMGGPLSAPPPVTPTTQQPQQYPRKNKQQPSDHEEELSLRRSLEAPKPKTQKSMRQAAQEMLGLDEYPDHEDVEYDPLAERDDSEPLARSAPQRKKINAPKNQPSTKESLKALLLQNLNTIQSNSNKEEKKKKDPSNATPATPSNETRVNVPTNDVVTPNAKEKKQPSMVEFAKAKLLNQDTEKQQSPPTKAHVTVDAVTKVEKEVVDRSQEVVEKEIVKKPDHDIPDQNVDEEAPLIPEPQQANSDENMDDTVNSNAQLLILEQQATMIDTLVDHVDSTLDQVMDTLLQDLQHNIQSELSVVKKDLVAHFYYLAEKTSGELEDRVVEAVLEVTPEKNPEVEQSSMTNAEMQKVVQTVMAQQMAKFQETMTAHQQNSNQQQMQWQQEQQQHFMEEMQDIEERLETRIQGVEQSLHSKLNVILDQLTTLSSSSQRQAPPPAVQAPQIMQQQPHVPPPVTATTPPPQRPQQQQHVPPPPPSHTRQPIQGPAVSEAPRRRAPNGGSYLENLENRRSSPSSSSSSFHVDPYYNHRNTPQDQ